MNKTQLYQTNLCKEILIIAQQIQCTLDTMSFDTGVFYAPYISETMTRPKYQFSRSKWHIADFRWQDQHRAFEWCNQQFGVHPVRPDAWSRWKTMPGNQFAFRDEKDYVLFVLRWGV